MGDTFKYIAPIFSWIMDAMAPEAPSTAAGEEGQGVKTNFRSTDAALPVVYGKRKVGGNDVFMTTTGSNNKYLWIVQTLAEGECDSIAQNDESVYEIYLDGELYTVYGGYVNYYFSPGTSASSGFAALEADYPSWTDKLRNTCAIALKLEWDENRNAGTYNFQGIPERLITLKGKKVTDFRDSSYAWSDNPVLCLYDYMTNNRYGMGLSTAKFDVTSWTAAANYCDTKDFTLNMVLSGEKKCGDVIADILSHFRGSLVWFDGKFYCRYADLNYESVVYHITDRDIVADEDGTAQITMSQPGRFSKPQMMEVTFYDEEKGYTEDTISIGEDDDKPEKLKLDGCTSRTMAANLGVYALERAILDRTISGSFRDHLVILDPHDLVYVTSNAMSIEDQLMRVTETSVSPDGIVTLTLQFESYDLYDDDYDVDVTQVYQSSLPDPRAEPPSVSNVQVEEELRYHRGRTYTDLSITFDPPDYAWYDHVEVYTSTTDTISAYNHQYDVTTDFKIENIREGSIIYIILRTVNIWGAKQTLENGYKINWNVQGKQSAPESISALAAISNENNVNLYADPVDDPDVEGYEFRLGDNWSAGVFLAFNRKPTYSMTGVKPGTHTFWCNTLGTNGVYGATPRSGTVKIPEPTYGYQNECFGDPDWVSPSGTFDNTEIIDYGGDPYLKVTHTPALTGTYLSEVFDAIAEGAPSEVADFFWINVDIVVVGTGTQWQSKFTGTPGVSGTTWFEGGATTQSWGELFELTEAPRVGMRVYYGNSNPPTDYFERMEILSALIPSSDACRYFRMYISITDPSSEVYAYIGEPVLDLWYDK